MVERARKPRGVAKGSEGTDVRRVIVQPGRPLHVILESQAESDRANERRLAVIDQADLFLEDHAGKLDAMRSGRIEDRDEFYSEAGVRLRELTAAALDNGVTIGEIVRRAQKGLIARGSSDMFRMQAIARRFGQELVLDRDALVTERAAAASAPVQVPPTPGAPKA